MPSLPPSPPAGISASTTKGPPPSPLTWQAAVDLLDTAPGVDQKLAQQVLAERGINMDQFPTANHFAAWTGLAPAGALWARQSGGKRFSIRLADSNQHLRTKGTYLAALYHRLAARRGKKRAIMAGAGYPLGALGVSFYHMLSRRQPYQDLGADYFDQRSKGVKPDWLLKQLTKLGYTVQLEPVVAAAAKRFGVVF
jgi:transposase